MDILGTTATVERIDMLDYGPAVAIRRRGRRGQSIPILDQRLPKPPRRRRWATSRMGAHHPALYTAGAAGETHDVAEGAVGLGADEGLGRDRDEARYAPLATGVPWGSGRFQAPLSTSGFGK